MVPCLRLLQAALIEPAGRGAVDGKGRPVHDDERVPRALAPGKEAVHLGVVRPVEIDYYPGIVAYGEAERRLRDGDPQLRGHPQRHIFIVDGFRILAADIVVAHHRDERQSTQPGLDRVHRIGQHLAVYIAAPAVPLDQVPELKGEARGCVRKAGSASDQARATLLPHLAVPGELLPLHPVEPFHRLVIEGMVDALRRQVVVGIPDHDHRIAPALPGRQPGDSVRLSGIEQF